MIRVEDITNYLEQWAPLAYQETYDNAGLIVGDPVEEVIGVLICLDITEAILEEARHKNCNLVIAHHPIIFRPIKKLTGANYVERCVIKAIKHNIAIYTMHTNLDNIMQGVNQCIAQELGLQTWHILLPKPNTLQKLAIVVPPSALDQVKTILHQVGVDYMGNNSHYSFSSSVGRAVFQHNDGLINSSILQPDTFETVVVHKIEIIFPAYLVKTIVASLKKVHPCEEIAYHIQNVENSDTQVGAGMIGELPQPLDNQEFLSFLKEKINLTYIKHSAPIRKTIKKVALCGGAGIFLLPEAIRHGADALVTADVKYHDFFGADGQLLIADIGHYESEIFIKKFIYNKLSEKFTNIVLLNSTTQTNPIYYF